MPVLGTSTWSFVLHGVLLGVMGLMCSWAATGCNSPVFAEVVPGKLRSLIYALDRCFEMAVASVGGRQGILV